MSQGYFNDLQTGASAFARPQRSISSSNQSMGNPLQALIRSEPDIYNGSDRKPVLVEAVKADKGCDRIYKTLNQRIRDLVGSNGIAIEVEFDWRVRVGGTRGFCDLLLPVFHPVFGIPYIPASTIKGATKAWAETQGDPRISELLGMLKGDIAKAAKVEFLDAFPTSSCLSVDVANPQWQWSGDRVKYGSSPYPLLDMQEPQIAIGILPTTRGTNADVLIVKDWIENALRTGIGSRVSSGYGRVAEYLPGMDYSKSYKFELWTEGMFGSDSKIVEFRPTALRGILRYWFRAIALSLYEPQVCKGLEDEAFGNLGKQGAISISAFAESSSKVSPYHYKGEIHIEAKDEKFRLLASGLLILAAHIGGFGRSARRPLHRLHGWMRGCHWFVDCGDLSLRYDVAQWQKFFGFLKKAFTSIQPSNRNYIVDGGLPGRGKRSQDVLHNYSQIWILKSDGLIAPSQVQNWAKQDNQIKGAALNLLYSDNKFKGKGKNPGNPYVGGEFGTPSFVWIKSIFPADDCPYQVITIIGVDCHKDRLAFAKALQAEGAMLVIGEMPDENQVRTNPILQPNNPGSSSDRRQRPDPPKLKR